MSDRQEDTVPWCEISWYECQAKRHGCHGVRSAGMSVRQEDIGAMV